jgi:hypothetical protein
MLQREFGGFDGSFLGTWVQFENFATFELFDEWRQAASPHSSVVQKARTARRGETVALLTTLDHETRHFHDHLLSPLGAASFRYRFQTQHLAKALITLLVTERAFDDATCLPVPLPRWFRLGSDTWDTFLNRLNAARRGFEASAAPLRPPTVGNELQHLTSEIAELYARLWRLWEIPEPVRRWSITPTNIWEASALLVQYAAAEEHFGPEGRREMLEFVYEHPDNLYVRSIRLLRSVLGPMRMKSARRCSPP